MKILGISGLYHDSAAALVIDGEIVVAVQEERFTRKKHDSSFPKKAIAYCLEEACITAKELDYIVFYDNPLLTLDRYMHNLLAVGEEKTSLLENGFEVLFSKRLWIHEMVKEELCIPEGSKTKFMVTKHHIAHAASAFFPSPYKKAVIVTIDGVGEWTTMSIGVGEGNHISLKEELKYPHSLGLFYSAFTFFCGFKVNSGDYKFMGLAPYGKPKYSSVIKENIINIKDDGSFRLNLSYFDYQNGRTMINEKKMSKLFDGERRKPESIITKREMDIAASVQEITEEIILKIVKHAKDKYGEDINSLVMAGGVALNCVANGKILKSGIFENVWVQPAAGDAGGAIGAALYTYYDMLGNSRDADNVNDYQKGSYLGVNFKSEVVEKFLDERNIKYHKSENLSLDIARLLSEEKIIGFFSGRMEFGPRALGHRSILADPRSKAMQSKLNLKIKYRESFRPFAPAVLDNKATEFFELVKKSPYMLFCADVQLTHRLSFDVEKEIEATSGDMLQVVNKARSDIPAVTHVDYSARIQTVDGKYNSELYEIIKNFYEITGCPIVINTSFNVRGEPIVCTPEDAYVCFMRTQMDILVLEKYILYKDEQTEYKETVDWRNIYELD